MDKKIYAKGIYWLSRTVRNKIISNTKKKTEQLNILYKTGGRGGKKNKSFMFWKYLMLQRWFFFFVVVCNLFCRHIFGKNCFLTTQSVYIKSGIRVAHQCDSMLYNLSVRWKFVLIDILQKLNLGLLTNRTSGKILEASNLPLAWKQKKLLFAFFIIYLFFGSPKKKKTLIYRWYVRKYLWEKHRQYCTDLKSSKNCWVNFKSESYATCSKTKSIENIYFACVKMSPVHFEIRHLYLATFYTL